MIPEILPNTLVVIRKCFSAALRTFKVAQHPKIALFEGFQRPKSTFWASSRFENFLFADVSCNIERSMCRMITPFASEDTLHLEEVLENMFGGVTGSRNFFRGQEDEALLLLQRNFLWGNPADFKFFNEKNSKKHEKSLSPCV